MDVNNTKRGREAADTDASSPPAEPVRNKSSGGGGGSVLDVAAPANRAGIGIIVSDADDEGAFVVTTVTPLLPKPNSAAVEC